MGTVQFTRQLGAESGVQLNPLRDGTELPAPDNSDQIFAIAARLTRGRIDKPFLVDRSNFSRLCGPGESMRASAGALNEAWVQIYEALNNGAYAAVVHRLVTSSAVVRWAVITETEGGYQYDTSHTPAVLTATVNAGAITDVTVTSGGRDYAGTETITVGGPGTGAVLTPTFVDGAITDVTVTNGGAGYTTAPTLTCQPTAAAPVGDYLFAVKHLECHNDGVVLAFHADEAVYGGVFEDNYKITLRLFDSAGVLLHEFYGSLEPGALDDYGNSAYLPDVVATQTDAVAVLVGADAVIPSDSEAYGYDDNGSEKWATSATLTAFVEGGTSYGATEYQAAREALERTNLTYGYIASGGSQAAGLLAQLAQLAFNTNRQFRFDVAGSLDPAAAISFVEQLNLGDALKGHLVHAYWAPLQTNDPSGLNGKIYLGRSAYNIALACLRNAQTDSNGFAPKNYAIAGKDWVVGGQGIVQTYTPTQQELNALAKAKINPVLSQVFSGGSRYVFVDQLTLAPVDNSLKKLISVAEMSTDIDDRVVRIANDIRQLPMETAIKRAEAALDRIFGGARTAKWLVSSAEIASARIGVGQRTDGQTYIYEVKRNAQRPHDRLDINYWLHYDGAARQIFVTQTLSL
jgi:hypothetical protein